MATIDLNRLAQFVAVAELGGFSRAAAQLGAPKSSVSRAVSQLEAELGVRLFHRSTRRVALSSAGASLYERVAPQLEGLRRATEELPERQAEPAGKLRITTLTDLGGNFLAEVGAAFVARYPAVQLELVLTDRLLDLVAERLDAALRISLRPLRDSQLTARRVGRVRLQLFAAPGYLEARSTPRHPRELAAHAWAQLSGIPQMTVDGPGGPAPLPGHGHIECNDGVSLRAAVRAGGGIALLPSFLVEGDVADGTLVRVLPRWSLRTGDLWFVCPTGRQIPPKVSAFRDFVAAALARRAELAL